jgi:diguanylate cyclase (GGDEF)-like protein
MRSLRSKILVLSICFIIGTELVTVAGILLNAKQKSEVQAAEQLVTGMESVDRFSRERASSLEQMANTLAGDFGFKKVVASGDEQTIRSVLFNQLGRVEVDGLALLSLDGSVISSTIDAVHPGLMFISNAAELGKPFDVLVGDQGYEMLVVEVRAPHPIALIALATSIDDDLALKMAGVTGLQASFLITDASGAGVLLASSFDGEHRLGLDSGEDGYLSVHQPYPADGSRVSLVLHQSITAAMAPFMSLATFVMHLAATTLIIIVTAVWWLSARLTRPVQILGDAAKRLTVGDYSGKAVVTTRDEMGALADAFNAMQDGIAQREQRITEMALTDQVTRLPNALQAMIHLKAMIGSNEEVALLLLDLGRFQHIRSTLGKEVAEEMLRLSAARMTSNLPAGAMLARLEADEFLLAVPVSDAEEAVGLAKGIHRLLDSGLTIRKARLSLEVHIGVAI